jgi:hypothetical protein
MSSIGEFVRSSVRLYFAPLVGAYKQIKIELARMDRMSGKP